MLIADLHVNDHEVFEKKGLNCFLAKFNWAMINLVQFGGVLVS